MVSKTAIIGAIPIIFAKKKNLSNDGSMDEEHNSLSSRIVGVIVSMDCTMAMFAERDKISVMIITSVSSS